MHSKRAAKVKADLVFRALICARLPEIIQVVPNRRRLVRFKALTQANPLVEITNIFCFEC
jgi:hypothetical protein